ncbi:hypothetical protein THMIRHAS_01160 [Thiosulfatimonas sediminis]|uniref:Uncharacterized protein n=1 Tax=Thiosulfatimonas sediminis TaxID=2675054 RepID=A0A6F8PRI9_9GAMM|nr:hypothetical protein [Thiosulfatimonas sediminis]BBP44743.1 hypothetical protein THMIRHAS_01160 [Thiosulfatimonas sediminis]
MNTINPTTSSALMSMQATQDLSMRKPAAADSSSQSGSVNSAASSTTVTLSSGTAAPVTDYLALNPQQTVQSRDTTSQTSINGNQTSSGMTYASSLQNQANYLMNETSPVSEERGERNS